MTQTMEDVERWAEYVKKHSDKEWSSQQKVLIDSQIKNAMEIGLSREQVLYIHDKKRKKVHSP
ncbi:MAG: hypothetical protein ABIB71_09405 [Candidatus Woesearchaeota archaeon]